MIHSFNMVKLFSKRDHMQPTSSFIALVDSRMCFPVISSDFQKFIRAKILVCPW